MRASFGSEWVMVDKGILVNMTCNMAVTTKIATNVLHRVLCVYVCACVYVSRYLGLQQICYNGEKGAHNTSHCQNIASCVPFTYTSSLLAHQNDTTR